MAYCAQMMEVGSIPGLHDICGSAGDRMIVDKINNEWSGGVLFGQIGDPFRDRFTHFTNVVTNVVNNTTNKIMNTIDMITCSNKIKAITEEDQLYAVPAIMRQHILTYAPIRSYLNQGLIDGWGIPAEVLPQEDIIDRLLHQNGKWHAIGYTPEAKPIYPNHIEHTWRSTDPILTWEELEDIDKSRKFIDSFMEEQLSPTGDRLDPTAFASGGTIGRII